MLFHSAKKKMKKKKSSKAVHNKEKQELIRQHQFLGAAGVSTRSRGAQPRCCSPSAKANDQCPDHCVKGLIKGSGGRIHHHTSFLALTFFPTASLVQCITGMKDRGNRRATTEDQQFKKCYGSLLSINWRAFCLYVYINNNHLFQRRWWRWSINNNWHLVMQNKFTCFLRNLFSCISLF